MARSVFFCFNGEICTIDALENISMLPSYLVSDNSMIFLDKLITQFCLFVPTKCCFGDLCRNVGQIIWLISCLGNSQVTTCKLSKMSPFKKGNKIRPFIQTRKLIFLDIKEQFTSSTIFHPNRQTLSCLQLDWYLSHYLDTTRTGCLIEPFKKSISQ